MAVVLLQSGDIISLGGNADIFGTSGTQTVTILDGSTMIFRSGFNAGSRDTVRLSGLSSNFMLSLGGSSAVLASAADGISITIPVGANGTSIAFDNGDTRVLVFNGTNVVLGAQVATGTPTLLDANNFAPVITSNGGGANAAVNVAENGTAVTIVTSTDADAVSSKTFSQNGGADAALFQIDPTTGALSFKAAPNFEAPADAGANNVYDVVVRVTDNGGLTDDQAIAVTVTNVNEQAQELVAVIETIVPLGQEFPNFGADEGNMAGAFAASAGDIKDYGFADPIAGAQWAKGAAVDTNFA